MPFDPQKLKLKTLYKTPYGWPLRQMKIPEAHKITQGSPKVIVAVIDLGYRFHPQHEGHLWNDPSHHGRHGWDCHDDDATLEYNLQNSESTYNKGHHAFIVGEIIACAPKCKVMVVRVGYGNPDSWWKGIDYAVGHGAKILVIPHGFISHGTQSKIPLFYKGTDFSYSLDNPQIRRALDDAYAAGCLIFKGTADNRGRRVAFAECAFETVCTVGSANRRGKPADICGSSSYVEIAAPAGERGSKNPMDQIWCTGGDGDYIPFNGGCMASGFAGGVAALVCSRFPGLSNGQIRQILRNTASGKEWDPKLGWGILDAQKAAALKPECLAQRLNLRPAECRVKKNTLQGILRNRGVFDVKRALITAFNGDPRLPAARNGTLSDPVFLVTRQIGHTIVPVRGLHETTFALEFTEKPGKAVWLQICSLDWKGSAEVQTVKIPIKGTKP